MRSSASTLITAQFLASILAARRTPIAELAETMAVVVDTVSRLASGIAPAPPLRLTPHRLAPARSLRSAVALPESLTEDENDRAPALAVIAELPARRRRGRPPKVRQPEIEVAAVAEEMAPVSRLLRRAEVPVAPAPAADPFEKDRVSGRDMHVKGVVKWFDTRSNKGVLRLAGMAVDVPLDAAILMNSRVKRLFKDQEVDVVGDYEDGNFHPKSLSVPGQTQESLFTSGQLLTATGRQSRQVMVEVKRLHPRFQSARSEAEHAFGKLTAKSSS